MYALTIAAANPDEHPVTPATLSRLQAYGEDAGLDPCAAPVWVEPHEAATLFFTHRPRPDHMATIRDALAPAKMDAFVRPASARPRLFMADMDATMVEGETMNDLADRAGLGPAIADLTAASMRGDMTFTQSFTTRVGMLKGVDAKLLADVRNAMCLNPGARTLVQTLKAHGVTCVLVSGGLDIFTGHCAELCGFDRHHGNTIAVEGGVITGGIAAPVLDRDAKAAFLQEYTQNLSLRPEDTAAIGDGANDLGMLEAAGLGVGYHAKKPVVDTIASQIIHGDLTALLYALGYSRNQWAKI